MATIKRIHFTSSIQQKTKNKLQRFVLDTNGKVTTSNVVIEYLIEKYIDKLDVDELVQYINTGKTCGIVNSNNKTEIKPAPDEQRKEVDNDFKKPTKEELRMAFKNM